MYVLHTVTFVKLDEIILLISNFENQIEPIEIEEVCSKIEGGDVLLLD